MKELGKPSQEDAPSTLEFNLIRQRPSAVAQPQTVTCILTLTLVANFAKPVTFTYKLDIDLVEMDNRAENLDQRSFIGKLSVRTTHAANRSHYVDH